MTPLSGFVSLTLFHRGHQASLVRLSCSFILFTIFSYIYYLNLSYLFYLFYILLLSSFLLRLSLLVSHLSYIYLLYLSFILPQYFYFCISARAILSPLTPLPLLKGRAARAPVTLLYSGK